MVEIVGEKRREAMNIKTSNLVIKLDESNEKNFYLTFTIILKDQIIFLIE